MKIALIVLALGLTFTTFGQTVDADPNHGGDVECSAIADTGLNPASDNGSVKTATTNIIGQ